MSTELTMLAYSALLTLALGGPPVVALIMTKGLSFAAGNREQDFTLPAWGVRANRAHLNMIENLPVFAALVLIANAMGVSNEGTALGATLFFWGRIGHAVVYIAGVPYLRTGAFLVSIIGMIQIVKEIL